MCICVFAGLVYEEVMSFKPPDPTSDTMDMMM